MDAICGNVEVTESIPQLFSRSGAHRSRVTNGSKLLPLADGRSVTARRFRDLYEFICLDLGGLDLLSEGQKQLARRAAMLGAECERLEAAAAGGNGEFDLDAYGVMCDRLGRLFQRLGLERKAKLVASGLVEHFARPPRRGAP